MFTILYGACKHKLKVGMISTPYTTSLGENFHLVFIKTLEGVCPNWLM